MLKLKLQYFGHLMWRTDSFEKTLKIEGGGEGDDRGWDGWMASPTLWTWIWASSGSWWWPGKPGVLQCMGLQRVRHNWVTELNWTECLNSKLIFHSFGGWGNLRSWLGSWWRPSSWFTDGHLFPGGTVVKNPPPKAGDSGSVLDWADPLEKEMATHSSILAWKIP